MKVKYNKEEARKLFFTSDLHFYHKNIIRYCNRPFSSVEQMNEQLILNWNNTVPPDGTVFVLGDFCFAGSKELKEILSRLNGTIILVKGNHDKLSKGMEALFEYTTYQLVLNIEDTKVYLNHFAFLTFAGSNNHAIQLFGHVHSTIDTRNKGRLKYLLPSQYDVGVDNNDYYPISWEQVMYRINKQKCKNNIWKRIFHKIRKLIFKN